MAPRSSIRPSSGRGSPPSPPACAGSIGSAWSVTVWETIPFRATFRTARAATNRRALLAETDLFLPTTERARRCLLLEGADDDADPGGRAGDRRRPVRRRLGSPWRGPPDRVAGAARLGEGPLRRDQSTGDGSAGPRLLIVGAGPERTQAAALCRRPGARRPRRGPGRGVRRDAVCLRRRRRASFSPACRSQTWEEQFGLVLAEALAAGAPDDRELVGRDPRGSRGLGRSALHARRLARARAPARGRPPARPPGAAGRISGRGRPSGTRRRRLPKGSRLPTSACSRG